MKADSHPPAGLAALLERLLPQQCADEIVGDLHEEFVRVSAARGRYPACAWYVVQAARLVGRAAMRRTVGHDARAGIDLHATHRGDSFMRTILAECRHAIRTLSRRPALTAVVVGTLSLGLAANAAIFNVIDTLIIRPFTLRDVDRLVLMAETGGELGDYLRGSVAPATYRDWTMQLQSTEHMAAFDTSDVNVSTGDETERLVGILATEEFFKVVGVEPLLGRRFTRDEETHGRHRVVILSHGVWQTRYGSDPAILGRRILLDAEPYEVIGVMPQGFAFPSEGNLWAPLALTAEAAARRDQRYLTVIGRLGPGRTNRDADTEIRVAAGRISQQHPDTNKGYSARAVTLVHGMRDMGLGPIVALWQASAAFVLLIACANVANLLLARGAERHREIAVRTALGASRGRIARELLLESLALALFAVPLALGLSWFALRLIRAGLPARLVQYVAGWESMGIDARLIAFTLVLAAATALIFGALPALRGSRPALSEALKEGARGTTAGHHRQRLRRGLVVVQIALALPLLVAAVLSALGAHRFLNGEQGYEPDGLLVMRAALPDARYADLSARRRFVEAVARGFSDLPGVESVAIGNSLPAIGSNPVRTLEIDGRPPVDPAKLPSIDYRVVTPGALATLRIPILRGRGFTEADGEDAQPVVIISKSMADRYFPDADPLGRRVRLGDSPWLTVIGVSGDVIHHWFDRRNAPTAYRPYSQAPSAYLSLAIRTAADPAMLTADARAVVRAVDHAQAVYEEMPMRTVLKEKTIGLLYVASIMAVFGAVGLVLAVIGVYGIIAVMVTQRRHEIGVRIALGAGRTDVIRLTVTQAARLTALGVALGLAASFALSRALEAALVGVLAADLRVSLGVTVILVASALLAGYVPARRATGIDPILALRGE